jgi:hypothetical protein
MKIQITDVTARGAIQVLHFGLEDMAFIATQDCLMRVNKKAPKMPSGLFQFNAES